MLQEYVVHGKYVCIIYIILCWLKLIVHLVISRCREMRLKILLVTDNERTEINRIINSKLRFFYVLLPGLG